MQFTDEQKEQIYANLIKITDYIETNILPHIAHYYETGKFGLSHYITLNGPYADKIKFCCYDVRFNMKDLAMRYPKDAVIFLEHWQDAKSYMNNEIKRNAETIKLIENFEI